MKKIFALVILGATLVSALGGCIVVPDDGGYHYHEHHHDHDHDHY